MVTTNGTPRLSVALPVYNGADYLREALDSILAQDFADFELVVSDNCSTDETPAILSEYARRDRRVRVSRCEAFLSQADNMSRAVNLSAGEWVKLLCHDDLMQPGCLRAVWQSINTVADEAVGLIGNGEAWLFTNGVRYSSASRQADAQRFEGRDFIRRNLSGKACAPLPSITTATVRKRAWEDGGGFDARFVHFDVFLWLRLLLKWDYVYLPGVWTINRIHGAQVAVSARRSLRSIEDHRVFYREFLADHARLLDLKLATRIKARLKPLSVAASTIAVELLKKRFGDALRVITRLPVWWWPALPLLMTRNLRQESRKLAALHDRVPISLIYPG